jgi:hypothetical protein
MFLSVKQKTNGFPTTRIVKKMIKVVHEFPPLKDLLKVTKIN